jgi:hypothetical protein
MADGRRSRLAREILENPLWKETFKELGQYYYEEFRACRDDESRRKIGIANDMLDDFEAFLTQAIAEGITVGDNDE